MTTFREQLRQILADRHGPEASALFLQLMRYAHGRIQAVGRSAWQGLLSPPDLEEAVGAVMLHLASGGLARFQGNSLPELLAYVKVIADRSLTQGVRQKLAHRRRLLTPGMEEIHGHLAFPPDVEVAAREVPDLPLPEGDRLYLLALLESGSQAELARRRGISRAAVTQRIHRIRARIIALDPSAQEEAQLWVEHLGRAGGDFHSSSED